MNFIDKKVLVKQVIAILAKMVSKWIMTGLALYQTSFFLLQRITANTIILQNRQSQR